MATQESIKQYNLIAGEVTKKSLDAVDELFDSGELTIAELTPTVARVIAKMYVRGANDVLEILKGVKNDITKR